MSGFIKKHRVAVTVTVIVLLIACAAVWTVCELLDLHLYFGWQEVEINESISIKVPGSWEKNEKDGLIYFTDPDIIDENIVLFQSKSEGMFLPAEEVELNNSTEKNAVSDSFQSVFTLSSTVNSLGSFYGESIIAADGIAYKESYVTFDDHDDDTNDCLFYTWKSNVDGKTLEKIADSVDYLNE